MKKTIATLIFSALSTTAIAETIFNNPFDDENRPPKFYGGGALGFGKHGDTCDQAFFTSSTCENTGMQWKVYGGIRVNPMLGIEAGYRGMGETSLEGTTSGNDNVALNKELSGFDISALGYIPISPELEVFGKAGLLHWTQDEQEITNGTTKSTNTTGNSLLLGAGSEYAINPNMKVRAEWEHVFNAGDDTPSSTDVDVFSIGANFSSF